ncbi:hypothetical protein M9Y10_042204 [Tritrichomonas musculus]|uniref:Uncharacterized protein n=1 Tax=Tritrichomonas musculus TaxID=1915356 RepID=A0ABR2K6I6_9EUKA
MTKISFRIDSIEFKDSTIARLNKDTLFRLNLTQKPSKISEEYIVDNLSGLYSLNHCWNINDPTNSCKSLTFTVREVSKKISLANIFNLNGTQQHPHSHDVDRFVGRRDENRDTNIQYDYTQSNHSLIGIFELNISDLPKGVDNIIKASLLKKPDLDVVGHANLEIYIWGNDSNIINFEREENVNQSVAFVDPGCPPINV